MQSTPESPSTTLLLSALRGDSLALDRLFLSFANRLSARIERRLSPELRRVHAAEDLLQEVLAEAFTRFSTFEVSPEARDPGEMFFAWLATIADHRVIDVVRAEHALKRGGAATRASSDQNPSLIALIELVAVHEHTPSRSASGHEAERAIRQAIETLSPDHRQVLELRYLEGISPADTALRMGRSEHAIHNLCGRAIGALREAMGDSARFLSQG